MGTITAGSWLLRLQAERMLCHQKLFTGSYFTLEHWRYRVRGPQKFARAGAMICNLGSSLTRSLRGAVPCLIWTRHAEASLSPDNCSFLHKNISLPHISEFTFLLLNQVVGQPARWCCAGGQHGPTGSVRTTNTQRGGATRHVGPSGTLVALGHTCCCFSCFFPNLRSQHDLFYHSQKAHKD